MKFYKLVVLVILTTISSLSFAGKANGKITHVFSGPGFGTKVFIAIDVDVTDKPECLVNTFYSFSIDSEAIGADTWLSMILMAYSTGKSVYVEGTNHCNLYSSIEDLKYIRLNP